MPDQTIQDLIRQEAQRAGVPAELALSVAEQESSFNPTSIGPALPSGAQAVGTFQLLPDTAKRLGVDPHNPLQNVQGGVRYLKELMDRHQGDLPAVLGEYGGVKTNTTYVPGVLGRLQKFSQPPSADTGAGGGPPAPSVRPVSSHGPAAPPPPSYTQAAADAVPFAKVGRELVAGFDPRTRLGRRNLAGGAAGLGAAWLTGGMSLPAQFLLGTTATGLAGGAEDIGEQVHDGASASDIDLSSVTSAGVEQGAQEAAGMITSWPFQAIGRRAIAPTVSHQAATRLETRRATMENQLDQALRGAEDTVRATKRSVGVTRDLAKERSLNLRDTAQQQGAAHVQQTVAASETALHNVRQRLEMGPPAPSPSVVGQLTHDAIEGPAKTAKDQVGEAVGAAAKTGPRLPTAPLIERLNELAEQITPSIGHQPEIPGFSPEQIAAINAKNPGVLTQLAPDHPLPALLDKMRDDLKAGPDLSFEDAHKYKRLLDDAVNWDRSAKKQVQQITKGIRQTLREQMSAHEPYNAATAAYADVVRLHSRGIAPELRRTASENPERLVRLIKGDEPTKLQMLKDLLLQEAPKGGGAAEGQAAWNATRAAWTHKKIATGGPEKLLERIDKLDPDFVTVMYGDQEGKLVLDNLRQIGTAYQEALTRGAEEVAKAKTASAGMQRTARRQGAQDILTTKRQTAPLIEKAVDQKVAASTARSEARKPTAEELRFRESSIHKPPSGEQTAADMIRAVALGPSSIWGGLSAVRLLHGPKAADLLYWSAQSPLRTRLLVRALTSRVPSALASDVIRAPGVLDKDLWMGEAVPSHGPPRPESTAAGR